MGRVFSKRLLHGYKGHKSPFFCDLNCHSMWQEEFVLGETLQLFTDAAGSVGYSVYFNKHWSNGL